MSSLTHVLLKAQREMSGKYTELLAARLCFQFAALQDNVGALGKPDQHGNRSKPKSAPINSSRPQDLPLSLLTKPFWLAEAGVALQRAAYNSHAATDRTKQRQANQLDNLKTMRPICIPRYS